MTSSLSLYSNIYLETHHGKEVRDHENDNTRSTSTSVYVGGAPPYARAACNSKDKGYTGVAYQLLVRLNG